MKRMIGLVLCGALLLTGCRRDTSSVTGYPDPYDRYTDYDDRSQAIYDDALGDFYKAYQAATAEENPSVRYALMAVAEAKLLGSGVMLPLTAGGGSYTVSRLAPYTVPHVLWGNDSDRYRHMIVTTSPIRAEHVAAMKEHWADVKGTGEYLAWAADYLVKQGYTLKDTHRMSYVSDPKTWDALATSRAADARALVNTYDGLYEYDCEGVLQPALAQEYSVRKNEDGTVCYTFTLKSGLNWVDSQGRVVAPLTADDFVAGMQHVMDAAGGLEYLLEGVIQGASGYVNGEITDFSQVGVRAVDTLTLEYTLEEDVPYFMTMLGYSVFAPMSRSFYTARGGKFGSAFDPAASSYTYGKSPDHIAYCGPYLVTNATAENTIVFSANPEYREPLALKSVVWRYDDGKDAMKAYNDTISGAIDGTALNAASLEKAKSDGNFGRYAYVSACDATTYFAFYNLDRQAFANFNDGAAPSQKNALESSRTVAALRNVHFRRAVSHGVNRSVYNAQTAGEGLKYTSLRNSFTPGTFVSLTEPVTISMGGAEVTYPAGASYGQILQDQLDVDGVQLQVFDPEAEAGLGSSDGFDGWYNPQVAREELALAVEQLRQQGIEISAEEPVILELPYFSGGDTQTNRAYAFKLSVEQSLGALVRVRLIPCAEKDQVYYSGYYATAGDEANYDVYDLSGWGPDYGDPQTYLSALLPGYEGYMTRMLGIF
ncbi:MAG: peptide ABC transporter substrate-binding protein [Oscillospiraceae bacterium]|nr:peptide ABC transporter substrate-binding protein [Oscillospiraceae bacterium]